MEDILYYIGLGLGGVAVIGYILAIYIIHKCTEVHEEDEHECNSYYYDMHKKGKK